MAMSCGFNLFTTLGCMTLRKRPEGADRIPGAVMCEALIRGV